MSEARGQLAPTPPSQARAQGAPAPITFRAPTVSDGAAMHALVVETGVLEPNTCYAYLLLATHFAGTCVLAERAGRLLGFVAAYRPPSDPSAVFVWQIGVRAEARGEGLARRLLDELVAKPACAGATRLEATVDPANEPSRRLFQSFARAHGAACTIEPGFDRHHFAPRGATQPSSHAPEELLRIGPLQRDS